MKQLMVSYKDGEKLKIRHSLLTDIFVPVEDVISPQKTTFTIRKTDGIETSDIIILRDNDSGKVEYIGYIDTISNTDVTKISCYPIINIFDNEFDLPPFYSERPNGYNPLAVKTWLLNIINREFVNQSTADPLQRMPFNVTLETARGTSFKKKYTTNNLFEVYKDVFINTGVYIKFNDLVYNGNEITAINCGIYDNADKSRYVLRWDKPSIYSVNIVDNTFIGQNKIIAIDEGAKGYNYEFYLLSNNRVSTDPNDPLRIKQVRSKVVYFNSDDYTDEDKLRRDLALDAVEMLQVPEYNLKIEIVIAKNDNLSLYRKVDFVAESGITYTTNITRVEVLNDLQVKITLGALRNSLTDFKKKVERVL